MNTENNKIIAEFMGFEIKNKINYVPSSLPNCMKNAEHLKVDKSENLPFHNDWIWLMEVVEKIEMLGFIFSIKKNWAKITKDKIAIVVRWEEDKNKIEAVYNACLEFIKWYNKQNQ